MSNYIHPRWGRPIDEYINSYDLPAAKTRIHITPSMEAVAMESISRVISLAGPAHVSDQNKIEAVTIQVLQSILNLALCPRTFHRFADPPLISGCVKLMNTMQTNQRLSPFSYEYGYLCFKIITIAVGVNILQRTGDFEMTVANMESDTGIELMLIFSGHVSRVIQHEIKSTNGTQACSWVLGWIKAERSPLHLTPLILRTDIQSILNTLWEDRELFLKVFMTTHSPGLSGVMFVLWRYLYSGSLSADVPPSHLLAAPFCEVLWRYMLVATTDQQQSLVYMNNDLQFTNKANLWNQSPKYVSPDDSRTIIQAYTGRMSPADPRSHEPLTIGAILVLLHFVTKSIHTQPGVDIFLPPLVGLTLDRVWDALGIIYVHDYDTVRCFGAILGLFQELIRPLNHAYHASRIAIRELVEALAGRNLLDMIAQSMLLLEPYSIRPSSAYDKCTEFLEDATTLFFQLEEIVPKELLEAHFIDYCFDWIKVDQHLVLLERSLSHNVSPHAGYFQACRRVWHQISQSLAIGPRINELDMAGYACIYPRCANPTPLNIGWLGFNSISDEIYCSVRCQAKHREAMSLANHSTIMHTGTHTQGTIDVKMTQV